MEPTVRQPDTDVYVDATNLRGLAHPLRVRALGWLRRHGPATATQLAEHLGQSSGATSYHLRQLATYGFVVEVPERGNGRERWWQAAHRATRFDLAAGDLQADETTLATGAEYLRSVARIYAEKLARFTDGIETLTADEPEWAQASTLSDWTMSLTIEQTRELVAELERLGDRFRDEQAADPDARTIALQVQVFPAEPL
jgi:DNA-binding transcriptional ArsR family regulator